MDIRTQILATIEHNSRMDVAELAVLLGTDEVSVANEIAALEADGTICGYHTIIDWSRTSNEIVSALIEVCVSPQRDAGFDKVAERIYKYPEVTSVYLISGSFDLMVIIEGTTLKDVANFVSTKLSIIESVTSCATHFILTKYKEHGTILARPYEDTREAITP